MIQFPLHSLCLIRITADIPHYLLATPTKAQLEAGAIASPLGRHESLKAKRCQIGTGQSKRGKARGFGRGMAAT